MVQLADELIYSHTHIMGIGLKGQPPHFLANKSWIYFPDSDTLLLCHGVLQLL